MYSLVLSFSWLVHSLLPLSNLFCFLVLKVALFYSVSWPGSTKVEQEFNHQASLVLFLFSKDHLPIIFPFFFLTGL